MNLLKAIALILYLSSQPGQVGMDLISDHSLASSLRVERDGNSVVLRFANEEDSDSGTGDVAYFVEPLQTDNASYAFLSPSGQDVLVSVSDWVSNLPSDVEDGSFLDAPVSSGSVTTTSNMSLLIEIPLVAAAGDPSVSALRSRLESSYARPGSTNEPARETGSEANPGGSGEDTNPDSHTDSDNGNVHTGSADAGSESFVRIALSARRIVVGMPSESWTLVAYPF